MWNGNMKNPYEWKIHGYTYRNPYIPIKWKMNPQFP